MLYWDQEKECMPRERLNELQLRRLKEAVFRVYAFVPAYRAKFDALGIKPDEINSLEDLKRLPAGRMCEVRLEELEQRPLDQVMRIYEELQLPSRRQAETAIREHLATIGVYQKNTYDPLSDGLISRVVKEWGRSFEQWEYATSYSP